MDVWKIGSRWSDHGEAYSSILDVFYNTKTVFAGNYKENFLQYVKIGDLFAITSGEKIVAVAKVLSEPAKLKDLGIPVENFYSSNYEDFDYEWEYTSAVGCKVQIFTLKDNDIIPIQRGKTFCGLPSKREQIILLYEKYDNESKGIGMIEELKDLLENSHNLVLRGAPGTGKTYLAKQIGELMTKGDNQFSTPIEMLRNAVSQFQRDEELHQKDEALLSNFQSLFPRTSIKNLTLSQYCIGTGTNNSFCWWIERGLVQIGKYTPGSSKTYKIWYNKETEQYLYSSFVKIESTKNPEKTDEDLMSYLAKELDAVINSKNFSKLKFGESFILKILNSYYPNEYLPINSSAHINNLIRLLGLETACSNKNIFEKNKVLFSFYTQEKKKNMSPVEFMRIIYSLFDLDKENGLNNSQSFSSGGDVAFVQFHPSYDYTDFIEGLRPTEPNDEGSVGFEKVDGIFKKFCIKALDNPSKKYVFIIDEINRGEVAKIFGELFYSIDPGYRVTPEMLAKHIAGDNLITAIRTQYSNMDKNPNPFDLALNENESYGHFFIPSNVYILGTMNDIDRSVESMDFAFRRRFTWKEIKASDTQTAILRNPSSWDGSLPTESLLAEIEKRMKLVNDYIWDEKNDTGIEGFSTAYHIGASYFLKLNQYNNEKIADPFLKLWTNHLESLFIEYLRGTGHESKIKEIKQLFLNPDSATNTDDESDELEDE